MVVGGVFLVNLFLYYRLTLSTRLACKAANLLRTPSTRVRQSGAMVVNKGFLGGRVAPPA